ncbi:MAG: hypothetical protein MUO62_05475 [Anaerolineales bacterium]|nr:hypothetical protein [Anaerolineales bacterium]
MDTPPDLRITQAKMLVQRLARLSADSVWAHKASGLRASMDKFLAKIQPLEYDQEQLDDLLHRGFILLEKAAQEIPSPEDILGCRD